jgi:hypothetical protein
MKDLKKRNIALTIFLFVTLLLSLAAVASAQDEPICSAARVAGEWGYTETGTLTLPAPYGTLPYASVGRYTLDRDGNLSGYRTASLGGNILKATVTGTATVNPDCTGTVTLSFTDLSGYPAGTGAKFIVYVDNAREARMIITSVNHPVFGSLLGVLTTEAKKLSPGHGNKD